MPTRLLTPRRWQRQPKSRNRSPNRLRPNRPRRLSRHRLYRGIHPSLLRLSLKRPSSITSRRQFTWDLEALITTTMIGGGLVGVTRGGTAAIHGIMATAGIPITLIQAFTDIADSTTTDMAVTMDTGGTTESLRCILQIKGVEIPQVQGVLQLQHRVEIRPADPLLLLRADLRLKPQRLIRQWRPIVLAQAPHPGISPVVTQATQATPWLAPAEEWRRRVATRSQGLRHMRRTRERHLRQLDKVVVLARASRPQVELIVP